MKKKSFIKPDEVVTNNAFLRLFERSDNLRGGVLFNIIRNWKKIIGKELNGKLLVKKFENNILWITVPDSMWLSNLMYNKKNLLKKINQFEESVQDIKFSVEKRKVRDLTKEKRVDLTKYEVDDNKIKRVENLLKNINNLELKEHLKNLFIKKSKFEEYSIESGLKICKKCNTIYNGEKCPDCGE